MESCLFDICKSDGQLLDAKSKSMVIQEIHFINQRMKHKIGAFEFLVASPDPEAAAEGASDIWPAQQWRYDGSITLGLSSNILLPIFLHISENLHSLVLDAQIKNSRHKPIFEKYLCPPYINKACSLLEDLHVQFFQSLTGLLFPAAQDIGIWDLPDNYRRPLRGSDITMAYKKEDPQGRYIYTEHKDNKQSDSYTITITNKGLDLPYLTNLRKKASRPSTSDDKLMTVEGLILHEFM